jgi:hypothetical protein
MNASACDTLLSQNSQDPLNLSLQDRISWPAAMNSFPLIFSAVPESRLWCRENLWGRILAH